MKREGPNKEMNRDYAVGEGGFRRERRIVTLSMRGEHKPNSAQIVWDDPVVNGVTKNLFLYRF